MTHPVPPPRKVQGTGRVTPRFNGLGPPLTGFFLPIIENAPENLEPVRTQNNIIYTLAVKRQTTDKLINKEFNLEEKKKRQRGAGEMLLSALGRPPLLVAGWWVGGRMPIRPGSLDTPYEFANSLRDYLRRGLRESGTFW